jgi:hypothetical protein
VPQQLDQPLSSVYKLDFYRMRQLNNIAGSAAVPGSEDGGCVVVPIKTNGGECEWQVVSNDEWLTFKTETEIADHDSGTGDGQISILIDPSFRGARRNGSISLTCNEHSITLIVEQ